MQNCDKNIMLERVSKKLGPSDNKRCPPFSLFFGGIASPKGGCLGLTKLSLAKSPQGSKHSPHIDVAQVNPRCISVGRHHVLKETAHFEQFFCYTNCKLINTLVCPRYIYIYMANINTPPRISFLFKEK